jgi:hypothetical protein
MFSVWFYRINQFPPIKIWLILLIFLIPIFIKLIGFPELYFLRGENSYYTIKEQSLISNFMLISSSINTIIFIVISYIKYLKIQRNEKNNGTVSEMAF